MSMLKISNLYNNYFDSGEDHSKDSTVYSDRLYQWDPKKYDELCLKHFGNVGQFWTYRDKDKIEEFLCDYTDKKVQLTKIAETENASTGYPIWIFWYKEAV